MVYDYMTGALEAVLFAAGEPLSVAELANIMQMDKPQIWNLLNNLENAYAEESRGLMLREIAGGYQLVTKPCYYNLLINLSQSKNVIIHQNDFLPAVSYSIYIPIRMYLALFTWYHTPATFIGASSC